MSGTKPTPKKRKILMRIALLAIGLALPLVFLEVVFRILPVSESLGVEAVNSESPVAHFVPDRTIRYSEFWNLKYAHSLRINKQGFRADYDYEKGSKTPLLAIVGDSFIEAAILKWEDTLMAHLNEKLEGRLRVYPFATSGSPLSQYLIYARYAKENYSPDYLLVCVVENDFDESLKRYKWSPSFHYFEDSDKGDDGFKLSRVDYSPSKLRTFARKSALARYLFLNLKAYQIWQARVQQKGITTGTTSATDEDKINWSKKAVDAFLARLPEEAGVPVNKIALAVDATRPGIYGVDADMAKAESDTYFGRVRAYLIEQAATKGYLVLDLQVPFRKDFKSHGERFEFPDDRHWNPRGHRIVAETLLTSGLLEEQASNP